MEIYRGENPFDRRERLREREGEKDQVVTWHHNPGPHLERGWKEVEESPSQVREEGNADQT
jgi:hypothetical protein